MQGFVISRTSHFRAYLGNPSKLDKSIPVVTCLMDPSTIQPWRNLWQAFKIRRIIKKYKIDVLHIIYAEPNALWAMFRHFFGVPIIVTTHGTDILKTIPDFFVKRTLLSRLIAYQYRVAFKMVDHVTCTSRRQIEIFRTLQICRPTSLIRTGVDLDLIRTSNLDMVASLGIKKPFVLMPRNMRPIYNHELTLDAIALLKPSFRNTFSFVFINADTANTAYFSKVYQKAQLINATIHFFPSLSNQEIISLSKQASLILMNPLSDGSPVTAMEAMACMVPVILPPLPYDSEVFAGMLSFDRWTPEDLSHSIEKVLSDNNGPQSLHQFAERIEKVGNIRAEMNKLMGVYKEIVLKKRSEV